MNSKNNCDKIAVIPQFEGTCWFNAILMVCFYSEGVRNIVLKHSLDWDKDDSLLNFFKTVIKYNYSLNKKGSELFYNVKPEIILMKIMKNYNTYLKKYYKIFNKNKYDINYWAFYYNYICQFLKILQIPFLTISHLSHLSNENLIFNLTELRYINNLYLLEKKSEFFSYINFDSHINNIQEILINNPEILIIDNEDDINRHYNYLNNKNNLNKFFLKNFNLFYTDYKSIKEEKDIITFNGSKYKLEACLLSNYNQNNKYNSGHAICGITCGNNKYVYNGWNSITVDAALNATNMKKSPCSLMKYDWDIHKNNDFCLNPKTCLLDAVTDHNDLCFNFGNRNNRILIYVKINDKNYDIDNSIINAIGTNSDISEKSELINDFFNIENIEFNDLLKMLIKFNSQYRDVIKFEYYLKIKDILKKIIESFKLKLDKLINIKYILNKYEPNIEISRINTSNDLYFLYLKTFINIDKPSIINNNSQQLLSEIKQTFNNYNLPHYHSISDLNQILFNLYKIKADLELFLNYLITVNNTYFIREEIINYILNTILLISRYFPNKIKFIYKKKFREIGKIVINDIYNIKDYVNKDELISNLKKELITYKSNLNKCQISNINKDDLIMQLKDKLKDKEEKTKKTKITKPEIIANIKKFNPLIKGLTGKNKDELLEIYNKLKK